MNLLQSQSLKYSVVPNYSTSAPSLVTIRRLAIFLLLGDLVGLLFCLNLAYLLKFGYLYGVFSTSLLMITLLTIVVLYIGDAYRPDLQVAGFWAPTRTLISCGVVGLAIATLGYLFQAPSLTQLLWRGVLLPGLGIFSAWAVLLRLFATKLARSQAKQSSCLLLGADNGTLQFEQEFTMWNPQGRLVILADAPTVPPDLAEHSESLSGSLKDLSFWSSHPWSGVIVAPHLKLTNQDSQRLMQFRFRGIPVYHILDFYETYWGKIPSNFLRDSWLAFENGFDLVSNRVKFKLKRISDLLIAAFLLLLLSPILIITALAIKLDSPGPIFYSQLRNGHNKIPFRVYKFRSMYQDAEKQGAQWAQQRDPRITRVGYWLRLMRIDELPQLWNVLKGDMSLIGPRPERPEFDTKLAAQIPYYNLRYLVKPGITGWAQVLYPYGASVEDAREKLSYDLYYIKNYSIGLDLKIVLKTIRVVLLGKGR